MNLSNSKEVLVQRNVQWVAFLCYEDRLGQIVEHLTRHQKFRFLIILHPFQNMCNNIRTTSFNILSHADLASLADNLAASEPFVHYFQARQAFEADSDVQALLKDISSIPGEICQK